ncbi:MAG: NAD(P)H-dependent oxidoreductase subunit E [Legionellales bacterium]|nr:MAG: NAD(P)H-dependent oxidoreductase subunit E [Legionellales bacterium]
MSLITALSDAIKQQIDMALKKFPENNPQSAIMPALTAAQDEHDNLTPQLMDLVAEYLKVPKISVYEVASFYSMYDLNPVGKYKISVCTNISCMLCNCDKITKHLKNKLAIDFNETSKDGKFTLKEVECLAACDKAPVMLINKQYHYNLTAAKIDTILEGLD